ncbi:MFS transporter [Nocardia sp. NPDC056000]|uniref:MFS transporter n=1 Tax=Nocardia sp. NPDC056000 TaxID=3345674 RepID=UPI0035DF36F9
MVESSQVLVSPPVRDRSNLILLVLCSAAFMAMLDTFIVNVAFTAIGDGFPGSSLADLSWVLNAYTIVYAALLIPAGRLADRYGRKRGFLTGLAVFTVASVACALAPSLWSLIGFRALQAAGAALLTPTSLGLLLTALPVERRATAVKIWATSTSLAAAIGPIIGGALVQLSWQWVFLVNAPVGVIAMVAGSTWCPISKTLWQAGSRICWARWCWRSGSVRWRWPWSRGRSGAGPGRRRSSPSPWPPPDSAR